VIRSPQDRGVLFLIDDRFTRSDVRRLLPSWWAIGTERRPAAPAAPAARMAEFPVG